MHFANRWFIVFLALYAFAYRVGCTAVGRTDFGYKTNTRSNDKDRNKAKQHEDQLPYKLENAPIPSIHDGPQVFRLETRSLSSKYEELDDIRRNRRHISPAATLNPQRPLESSAKVENHNESDENKHFHHPGHSSELRSHYPINSYNYYRVLNMYGSAYPYGNNQTFEDYVQSSNIGIIPPKPINDDDYYTRIKNLIRYPMISRHTSHNNQNQIYASQYNYGDNLKNTYIKILTALSKWVILNGFTSGTRYYVYDYKTLPQNYNRNITFNDDIITQCLEDISLFCGDHSKPICMKNGTTFCVTTSVVPCDVENRCANITIPCNDCEENQTKYLPCAGNIVVSKEIFDKQKFDYINPNDDVPTNREVILCVTLVVLPACDKPNCVEHKAETKGYSFDESVSK